MEGYLEIGQHRSQKFIIIDQLYINKLWKYSVVKILLLAFGNVKQLVLCRVLVVYYIWFPYNFRSVLKFYKYFISQSLNSYLEPSW